MSIGEPADGRGLIQLSREDVIRAYRTYAPVYDALFGRTLEQGRRRMAEVVASEPCARILEVGVGTGLSLRLYPSSAEIWAIDLSREMLAKAALAPRSTSRIAFARMDAERLAFPDRSFDCVTAPYVLSVTPDPRRLLGEMVRVCRPGGRLIVLNHFRGAGIWTVAERLVSRWASRVGFRSTLREDIFGEMGITVESVSPVNMMGLSRLVVARRGFD